MEQKAEYDVYFKRYIISIGRYVHGCRPVIAVNKEAARNFGSKFGCEVLEVKFVKYL